MYKLIRRKRRAVTNIVATMLIFGLMAVSMGLLYSMMLPTLLGYDAKTRSTNQEFILTNIEQVSESLISSPEGSMSRVRVVSNDGLYDVDAGISLYINITDGGNNLVTNGTDDAEITQDIGRFLIYINGTFQYEKNDDILTRISNIKNLVQNDTRANNGNFVSIVDYDNNLATYQFYSKARVDAVEIGTTLSITVTIVQITFLTYSLDPSQSVDFPINTDEWTLRIRRQAASITTISQANVNGPFTLAHAVDGDSSDSPTYSYGQAALYTQVDVNFVVVPLLFSI